MAALMSSLWPLLPPADAQACAQLNMTPGTKGLKKLLGAVPSWVTFQEREKVEVRFPALECLCSCVQASSSAAASSLCLTLASGNLLAAPVSPVLLDSCSALLSAGKLQPQPQSSSASHLTLSLPRSGLTRW